MAQPFRHLGVIFQSTCSAVWATKLAVSGLKVIILLRSFGDSNPNSRQHGYVHILDGPSGQDRCLQTGQINVNAPVLIETGGDEHHLSAGEHVGLSPDKERNVSIFFKFGRFDS